MSWRTPDHNLEPFDPFPNTWGWICGALGFCLFILLVLAA